MDPRTDTDLVKLAQSGDKNAFSRLIERCQPMAQRLALSMVPNENIAKEMVQEAMLQAYLSLGHLKDKERFRNWFYGITLNVCRSYIRDQKIDFFSWEAMLGGVWASTPYLTEIWPNLQEITEAKELRHLVRQAIESLSPKNQEVIRLFYYEELSLQEIATTLNISVTAVKGRLHKSRKQLREKLLPLYLEISESKQRRSMMIKVEVADVITEKVEVDGAEKPVEHTIVILFDEEGHRILPIWVGPFEGRAIAAGVKNFPFSRPVTFNFISKALKATGVELEEVFVTELRDETFYAIARLRNGNRVEEIDARPSDAIALAIHLHSPIYVAEAVMERVGIDISAEITHSSRLGQGLETVIKEMEAAMSPPKKVAEELAGEQEEDQKRKEKIKTLLFGDQD